MSRAITTASTRAVSLTKQLLTFSRKQVSSPLVFDLNSIVRETGRMLPRIIGEHIEIGIVLSGEQAPVLADPTQVQQVLMNLAANARDAMPEGGKLTIGVANWEMKQGGSEPADVPPGHYVTLTVSDTGAGMSPDIQSRAFDPFFTTKDIGKGTGLGLSTVYGIVKGSGGSILLNSERGEGTTFRIYLPRAKEEIIERAAPSRVPDESLRGSETILLVEDQSELRHLTHRFLQGLGYEVLVASLPEEAIQIAQQFTGKIDLLLTDVVMPGMNGRALAQQLRPLYDNMRVLYMSGFADQTLEQDVLDTNDAFMAKPFLLRELATKIREFFHEPKSACYTQKRQTRVS
jgi:two-component system cell cycle sensor histidine kinase/response regulator CckA